MALSNISKTHLEKLLQSKCNDIEQYRNKEQLILQSTTYAKLDILFKQLDDIKNQIKSVVNEGIEYNMLNCVECSCKKVPGNVYHLYRRNELDDLYQKNNPKNYYFSMIAPNEWNKESYHEGTYQYNLDGSYSQN